MDNNTVILRVELNEGKTEERLAQLVVSMAKTRDEQTLLTKARNQGLLSEEAFGKESVKLTNQLTLQRNESRNLTKDLQLYRTANEGIGTSYKNLQAQLSLAQRQFQLLDGSADNSSESAQALSKTIEGLRGTLRATDEVQQNFSRSIGNYPKNDSLEKLVQQLVSLQEQEKRTTAGTEDALKVRNQIGYVQQAAIQRGAEEGKAYEETTNFIKQYGEAIRPATADLIKLAEQQQQVAQSGGEVTEEVKRIGFQMGAAKKSIKDTTDALATVPAEAGSAAGGVKGFGDTISELDSTTGAFGGQVANLKQQFTQAKQGIELARVGFTGLKGAIAATGIGVLILTLGVLYEYFTKTDEGAEDLAAGLAYLKGLFSVVESAAISAAKGLRLVFTDPLVAGKELLDFVENNLINRVKSFGVLWEAIKTGDATKLVDSAVQFTTGITDATAKGKELTAEMKRTADAAYSISRAQNDLEDSQRRSLNDIEKNKNAAAQLLLSSKDLALSDAQRLANLDKASELEKKNLVITTDLAKEKLRIAKATNDEAERTGKTDDGLRDAVAQAEADVTRLIGESNSFQQTVQNRRSHLLQDEANDAKGAAAKATAAAEKEAERRVQLRKSALELEATLLDRQLKTVQINSDEELHILQQKLRNGYEAELNVKHLTIAAKQAADAKYESETLALTLDFNRRKMIAALQAQSDLLAAELAGQEAGSAEALRLQAEQIEKQRQLAIASLAANANNEAVIAKTNAQAAQQQRDLEYKQVADALQESLKNRRLLVERDFAAGLIQEAEYQDKLAKINKVGTNAQTLINKNYRQSNKQNEAEASTQELEGLRRHTAEVKQAEEAKQTIKEATVAVAQKATDTIITLFGEESAAGQAAMAFRKILALAEIELNLQKELSAISLASASIKAIPIIGPALGTAYEITEKVLAIAGAAAAAAAVLKLEQGGMPQVGAGLVASGPRHSQGGIPLYYRGRPAGYEIEGGEPVLHRGVSANPLLLSMASAINQMAGGRALVPNLVIPRMALGGVAPSFAREQLRGNAGDSINYTKLGQATAKALRQNPPVTRWSDFKAAEGRAGFTDTIANS